MARRHEVLEAIKDHKRKRRGDGPSYRTLLSDLNKRGYQMCLATLRRHVRQLADEGLLENLEESDGRMIVRPSTWLDEEISP